LDGLRALAVSLVLLSHLCGADLLPESCRVFLSRFGDLGNLGVRIFFVISGFLITTLLLTERAATGRISLKNFYLRRLIRIFPAAYTYITVIGILGLIGLVSFSRTDFLSACTYTTNMFPLHKFPLAHLWTLAVEEQFYLLWPLALCLAGKRGGVLIAAGMFLIGLSSRYVALWLPDNDLFSFRSFLANADALACGCLLAGLRGRLDRWKLYTRIRRSWLYFLILVLVATHKKFGLSLGRPLDISVLNVCIVLGLDWCVCNSDKFVGRALNWRPVAFVGVLSYSLYLWQQVFLTSASFYPINVFPVNLLLTFLLAALSYYCVERQFFKLRHRLAVSALTPDGRAGAPGIPHE